LKGPQPPPKYFRISVTSPGDNNPFTSAFRSKQCLFLGCPGHGAHMLPSIDAKSQVGLCFPTGWWSNVAPNDGLHGSWPRRRICRSTACRRPRGRERSALNHLKSKLSKLADHGHHPGAPPGSKLGQKSAWSPKSADGLGSRRPSSPLDSRCWRPPRGNRPDTDTFVDPSLRFLAIFGEAGTRAQRLASGTPACTRPPDLPSCEPRS